MKNIKDKLSYRGILHYNTNLTKLARKNRNNPTEAEKLIWDLLLRNKLMLGYKFTRQKPINNFILDFYCSRLLLGIEVDGNCHKWAKEYDHYRKDELSDLGIRIVRFWNSQVINKIDVVKQDIEQIIINRIIELDKTK